MPSLSANPTPKELYDAHNEGMIDWIFDLDGQRQWEEFCASQPNPDDVLASIRGASQAIGRALLYLSRNKYDPGAFSKEAQTTGDCVSHGARNAVDVTRSVEIHIKNEPEEYFKRSATEPTYGCRGHGGPGMDPGRAAKFQRDVGWLVRKNYEGVVDLSVYNSSIGSGWGRRGVPEAVQELCRLHNVGELVVPKNLEQAYDLLATGRAGHSGQSWGTSSKAPKDGINRGPGARWSHDMGTVGYDKTCEIWKEPVFFIPNSWGDFNEVNPVWKSAQEILGPWIPGMIVISEEEYDRYFIRSGSIYFYSSIKGFPMQKLPNYGAQTVIA